MAQPDPSRWSDHLPLVLLSLRSTLKADIGCTAADLVYGTSLRLPGDYVERLRSAMRNLRATPPRASPANSFIPPDLDKCDFVWVRHDAVRRPLQPPYDGPYKVLRRSDKDVLIERNGKTDTVSIDRVKPAYIDDSDHSSPQHCTPPQTLRPPPSTGDSPPPVRHTRSGRHVHWPDSLEVLTVYRPPRSDPEADARLLEELGRFALRPDVLIMGDFNAPLIDWSSLYARGPELAFDLRFLDMALRSFLTQHVLFPTRAREGQQSNFLDLVLTKSMDSIDETGGDVEISEDGEKTEHFSQFFKSIFTSESPFTPPDYDFDEGPNIESVSFDEATVRKELMTLNESKSPGPDDIPPKLLKELAAELAKPLSMLFQASFEAGCLPADWKSARITPLHKGGSKASANNYRPISLTSICCKLMEKIIKRELMRFLGQHNLVSDAQHGFRSRRSCVTNLLNCLERWTRSVDEGNALHVVYIDFKKAFDSVPHQRLLHKLSRTGVRGNLLKWIQSFLLDRCQTVHVGGQKSTEVAVESGVPQGSVLGPTLFIIYVNDCVSELDCGVAMFADDITLWSVIRTADDEEHLQENLNRLQQWSKACLLPFNEKKCNILRVGRARSPNHIAYCLNGIPLQEVDSQKDLGVWITTSLKPSLHCTKIAKSAMSVLYLVKRAFSAFEEDCFAKVFRTFVRPQLEFAIQAWRHWTAKDLTILERVQRRATKLVAGQGSLPYATRLANLDLFPLSYRQLRGDLIQAFRIIRGQDCSLVPRNFFELATTTNLRGHPFKLRVTGARLDTRKFFSNRVLEACNALPVDVVMSASVEVFKRKLDLRSSAH
nr:unnamed protein product [Spirometra erinaceieuropaei]